MTMFERTRPETCLSNLAIDRLLSGDLDITARQRHDAHLAECQDCRSRVAVLTAELSEFQASGPPLLRQADIVPFRPRRRLILGTSIGATLAAAAGVLLILQAGSGTSGNGPVEEIATKGGSSLGFYVKHAAEVRPGENGTIVYPQDQLRFTYTADRAGYIAVLSVDGAGVASIYYPVDQNTAAPIEPGVDIALPASTELDATLGQESLYGLFCEHPVALEPVRAALAQTASPSASPPNWPSGCTADRITIEKRAP